MGLFTDQREYNDQQFKGLGLTGSVIPSRTFNECTFSRCVFREAVFDACIFRECAFIDCDLTFVNLAGCTFSETRFEQSRLVGINFAETTWAERRFLLPVRFIQCTLKNTTFIGLDMHEITMTRCLVKEGDFAEANLTGADCTHTDFSGSRFLHTNLTGADLRGASNYAIDVMNNTIKGARFSLPAAMALLDGLEIEIGEAEG
jgi:fluoroquinolone resistance protein